MFSENVLPASALLESVLSENVQGGFFDWFRPKSSKCWKWQNPYQKSESKGLSQRKCEVLTQTFTFLVGVLQSPALRTLRAEPVKKNHPVDSS